MNNIIRRSVRLQCDACTAFEMFTVREQLESWLTVVAEVEPVVGGGYELFWVPEDRENNSTIGCSVTAIEPNQLLAFEWRSPVQYKHFANNADPLTHVVVAFIPDGEYTYVHLIHSGWRSATQWDEARQWQDRAWEMAFAELEKLVNDSI